MNNYLESFLDEDGQGLVEYGLLIILVVIVVFVSLRFFGNSLSHFYNLISLTVVIQHHKRQNKSIINLTVNHSNL